MKYAEENNARTRVHNMIYIKDDLHVFHINYKVVRRSFVCARQSVDECNTPMATVGGFAAP